MRPRQRVKALRRGVLAGEPHAIHDTRKLTRDITAELTLAGAPRGLRRQWREQRRALGPLRDLDITGEHLRAHLKDLHVPARDRRAFQTAWTARRAATLRDLHLPPLPRKHTAPTHPRRRARRALPDLARDLLRTAPGTLRSADPAAWHDLRKALKRYRATLRILHPIPAPLQDTLDALGRVQDATVILHAIQSDPTLAAHLHGAAHPTHP